MSWWAKLKERYEQLLVEYGKVAIVTYLVIFFGTWATFITAIRMGYEVSNGAGQTGTVVIAYAATKLTQPLRIGATILLTPVVATLTRRFRRTPKPDVELEGPPAA